MRGFERENTYLSLCGLNCHLCPMHVGGYCGGCGNGNQSCRIARCSLQHGGIAYCTACCEYPCSEYVHDAEYDSFITYQNRRRDLEKVQTIGQEAYKQEQLEKIDILCNLLDNYNDGRKKSFYCLSVNLLELEQLRAVMQALAQLPTMPKAEAAKYAEQLLREIAAKQGIVLRLRRAEKNS